MLFCHSLTQNRFIVLKFIINIVIFYLVTMSSTFSQDKQPGNAQETTIITEDDLVLGDPEAPVTIFAYESFTCPHCAAFHEKTLPDFKKTYIDTGKVKLVFRAFPFDQLGLRAAMLVYCTPAQQSHGLVEILFREQEKWSRDPQPVAALQRFARFGGLSDENFEKCMSNETVMTKIINQRLAGENYLKISSTPSFIVNQDEARIIGARGLEDFDQVLKPFLQ